MRGSPPKRKGRNPLSLPTVGLVGVGRFACNLVYLLKRAEQPVYLNETLPREFILPSRVRCDRYVCEIDQIEIDPNRGNRV